MRGVVSAESPSAWPTEALKAQAVAARTYAITEPRGRRRLRPVRRHALAGLSRRRGRDAEHRRRRRGHQGPGRHLRRPAGDHLLLLDLGRRDRGRRELVRRLAAQAVAEGGRRPVRQRLAQAPLGPVPFHRRPRSSASCTATCRGASSASRSCSAASRRASCARRWSARGGVTNVTGPQLRSAFGLLDTWAFFTSVTSKASKPKPEEEACAGAGPADRRPDRRRLAGRPRGQRRTRCAWRAPSPRRRAGRWLRVERRAGTRWVDGDRRAGPARRALLGRRAGAGGLPRRVRAGRRAVRARLVAESRSRPRCVCGGCAAQQHHRGEAEPGRERSRAGGALRAGGAPNVGFTPSGRGQDRRSTSWRRGWRRRTSARPPQSGQADVRPPRAAATRFSSVMQLTSRSAGSVSGRPAQPPA